MAQAPQEVARGGGSGAGGGPGAGGGSGAGDAFEAALDAIEPLAGTACRARILEGLEECRRIYRHKLAPAAAASGAPVLAVVAGGTNVGKTTVLNALAGEEVARATPIARGTKAAVLYVSEERAGAFRRAGFLPGYERRPLASPEEPNEDRSAGVLLIAAHRRPDLEALALADSPDIDSVFGANRRVAWDLLYAADAVVFVASEEKYNDEVCVAFLEKAFRHGKAVVALLNKSSAPEAAADFREKVVPGATGRGGGPPGAARVFEVPFFDGRDRAGEARRALAPVARAIGTWAGDEAERVRAAARAGAARALGYEAGPALDLLRREAEALAHYRSEVKEAAAAAARTYRAGLPALPIFEFDRVFRLLAEALKVPVIDDVYARVRAAGAPLGLFFRKALGLGPPRAVASRQIAERDRRDLEAARVRLGEALAAVRRLADRYPPEMAEALRRALLPSPEADALFDLDSDYRASLSREAEHWVEGVLMDLHARLRSNPGSVAIGRALKGTIRLAFATVAVVATGHVGLEDLLIAPVVDLMVKFGVEKLVDRAYFAEKRDEFYDARAAVFGRLVEERAMRLALGSLAGGASPEAIARLERAIEEVSRKP